MRDIERQIKSGRLKEKACVDVESHFWPFSSIFALSKKTHYGRTDGPTDRPTDRRTNGPTDPRMEIPSYRDAWTHLKMQSKPILEPNPEYVTRQKMHISYSFSSKVVFAKNIFSCKPKKMHFRHKITYPIFNSICDLWFSAKISLAYCCQNLTNKPTCSWVFWGLNHSPRPLTIKRNLQLIKIPIFSFSVMP